MSILRTKAKPADLSAKMPLRLDKDGDILVTADGTEGYVELWAEDALAVKNRISHVQGEFSRAFLIQQKRSIKDVQNMSATALNAELEKMKDLTIEGLAIRVKSWLLVDESGAIVDLEPTMENAKSLFSDDDFRLYATDWLENSKDAFLPAKSAS